MKLCEVKGGIINKYTVYFLSKTLLIREKSLPLIRVNIAIQKMRSWDYMDQKFPTNYLNLRNIHLDVFTRSFYHLDLNCLISPDIIRGYQKTEVLVTGNDKQDYWK